ncbi:MAG TPA: hypothetical protein PKB06_08295 [Actinotalea sp.]|nr:hypothetical protein [Actinotalea sp.]
MATRADTVLATAVGAVVLGAVAAGVVAAQRSPAPQDPDSPAGVVQTYLTAVVDRRPAAAVELLAATSPCALADLTQAYWDDDIRADLGVVEETADLATVHVRITSGTRDPFSGGWQEDQSFVLRRDGGQWRITGMPWPMYWCERGDGQ